MKEVNGQGLRQICFVFKLLAILDLIAGAGLTFLVVASGGPRSLDIAFMIFCWSAGAFLSLAFAAYAGNVLADIHGYFLWAKAESEKRAQAAAKPRTAEPSTPQPRAKVISGDIPEGWGKK